MLNIINNLSLFFEDCYRRINVREYSRLMKISPPTASKLLSYYKKLDILSVEKDRNYLFYYANKDSRDFIDLSRIYWRRKLLKMTEYLNKETLSFAIILFGSLSKAEAKRDSDIDLFIMSDKRKINLENFEKEFKRKIQTFFYNSIEKIDNPELRNNILGGYILNGRIKL